MAGVIIAVASTDRSNLEPLLDAGIPIVAVDRRPRSDGIDSVLVDNRLGAAGRPPTTCSTAAPRRVACITGPARLSNAETRLAGYRDALTDRGLAVDESLVRRADFREDGGHAAALVAARRRPTARRLLRHQQPDDPRRAAGPARAGLRVPDDVTIVGFDDAPWTTLVTPELSVVAQPTYEIGREAARLLATATDRVRGPPRGAPADADPPGQLAPPLTPPRRW